jgi:hypothetical protein
MRSNLMLLLAALLLNGIGAQAGVLDKESCAKLEVEQTKLEQAGVRGTIAKGPQWAKANLPLDKLQEVRRLIEVDELLTFRCQGKPLVLLPSSVDADPPPPPDDAADTGKDPEGKATPKADTPKDAPKAPPVKKAAAPKVEKAEPKAKAEPKVEPKAETPAKKAAAPPAPKEPIKAEPKKDASGQTAVAKPKPAPKKKVDDAYKPSTEPGENPFAGQMPKN